MLGKPFRRLQRGREILGIISRDGFEWLLSLGLDEKTAAARIQSAGYSFPRMIEALGPVFVRLGQTLAARPGLFAGPIMDGLARIEDRGDPRPFAELRSFVADQLGADPDHIFSSVQDKPAASLSTGLVYRAKLRSGGKVALEVRRPGIERLVEVDLDLLTRTIRFMERHTRWTGGPETREILNEVRRQLKQDLYLPEQGRNCERLGRNLASCPQIRIPNVFWEYSSPDLLAVEALEGVRLSRLKPLSGTLSCASLGKTLADLYLRQILVDGFFHACPSPEKLALDREGRILLCDYRSFGSLSQPGKALLNGLISAIRRRDVEGIGALLAGSNGGNRKAGQAAFSRDLLSALDRREPGVPRRRAWDEIFSSVVHLAKKMRPAIPQEILSASQTLATLEKTVRYLSPQAHLWG